MRTNDQSWAKVATPTVAAAAATIPPRRRWLRFSLRSLLILITVLSIWLGVKVNQARRQKDAVAALRGLGATVYYEHQRHAGRFNTFDAEKVLDVPGWLRELAGDDFFQSVVCVQFSRSARPVTNDDLAHLAALPRLESLNFLDVAGAVTDAGLANLPRPDRLVCLIAQGTLIGDETLKRLADSTRLEVLHLDRTRVTEQGLRSLGEMTALRALSLADTRLDDSAIEAITDLPWLAALSLDGTQVTDAGLAHLARCKRLTSISLNNTAVSDAGVMHLAGLLQLGSLSLQRTQVRGPGLAGLSQCVIEILDLKDTPIGDAGLAHLRGIKSLTALNIEDTALTDAGLLHLHHLPQLSAICLEGTQVSKEGIAKLTKALPGLAVVTAPKRAIVPVTSALQTEGLVRQKN